MLWTLVDKEDLMLMPIMEITGRMLQEGTLFVMLQNAAVFLRGMPVKNFMHSLDERCVPKHSLFWYQQQWEQKDGPRFC